jgi:hypothetical protein
MRKIATVAIAVMMTSLFAVTFWAQVGVIATNTAVAQPKADIYEVTLNPNLQIVYGPSLGDFVVSGVPSASTSVFTASSIQKAKLSSMLDEALPVGASMMTTFCQAVQVAASQCRLRPDGDRHHQEQRALSNDAVHCCSAAT